MSSNLDGQTDMSSKPNQGFRDPLRSVVGQQSTETGRPALDRGEIRLRAAPDLETWRPNNGKESLSAGLENAQRGLLSL